MAANATFPGALVDRFNAAVAAGDIGAIAGGIWDEEAPEGTALPCVILKGLGEEAEWNFEDSYQDVGSWSFWVYSEGMQAAWLLARQITNVFSQEWENITITNAKLISMLRGHMQPAAEEQRSDSGQLIFRIEVDFATIVRYFFTPLNS